MAIIQPLLHPVAPGIAPAAHAWGAVPRLVASSASHDRTASIQGHWIEFPEWVAQDEIADWQRVITARRWVMTTIAEVAAGAWTYERLLVVIPTFAGMDPSIREVWDIGAVLDNGHVLLIMAKDRWVHPDTVVFLEEADPSESRRETRFRVTPAPTWTDVPQRERDVPLRPLNTGTLCVSPLPDDASRKMVVWRRDGRSTFGFAFSVHDSDLLARNAMEIIARRIERGDIPIPQTPHHHVRYDGQKARVYRWDDVLLARFPVLAMTLDHVEAQQWADHACRMVGVRSVTINFNDRLRRRCYYKLGQIELATWGRTLGTLIHEIGHHCVTMDASLRGKRVEPHGAEYVGWMLRLLALVPGVDRQVVEDEAKALGLRCEA